MMENDSRSGNHKNIKFQVENQKSNLLHSNNEGIELVSEQEYTSEQNESKTVFQMNYQLENSNSKTSYLQYQSRTSQIALQSLSEQSQKQIVENSLSLSAKKNKDFLVSNLMKKNKLISQFESQVKDPQIKERIQQRWRLGGQQKRVQIRFDDIKMYNSKWISRLWQLEKNCKFKREINVRVEMNENQASVCKVHKCEMNMIKTELRFPQWLNQVLNKQQDYLKMQKISSTQRQEKEFHLQMMQRIYKLRLEQIFLIVEYHSENLQLQRFLLEPINQREFSIEKYTVLHFLSCEQVSLVKKNFNQFHEYISSKSLNQLFLVNQFSFFDLFCHQHQICQHKSIQQPSCQLSSHNSTLLEKIIALRKLFKFIQQKPQFNKSKIFPNKQFIYHPIKLQENYQQLYGNKELIDELSTLYGVQSKVSLENIFNLENKLYQKSPLREHIKFVQFVPTLSINESNYTQFISQVSQMKKAYFNGVSVGFQGFRISNFTTRPQNNITFVFHDFHELIQLQSLLIDFEFPLNYIEQIKKQYIEFPNKRLKKIKIKFHVGDKQKTKSNDPFGMYGQNQNNITNKQYLALRKNPQLSEIKFHINNNRSINSTMVNSSFLLEPSGYYEKIQQRSTLKEYLKEFYFYKIEKDLPDYQRLIKHVNSLSSVSKTLIMPFQCIFTLIRLRDSLSQLINICSHFTPTELHILPQPLQLVKVHEDYRSNIVTLKDQVRELLENEDKFGCLGINRSGVKGSIQKLNSINSFNIAKVHEEYLMKRQLFERIHKNYSQHTSKDNPIYNSDFEQVAVSIEFLLPNPKAKFEFICFPFHNKTFKIVKYFEPGTQNLLNLQLKETNQRSENFLPVEEITLNQYKTKMIKQGLDFFYFSYPFGDKFKLSLLNHHMYTLTLRNQLKFNKLDHLRILYWLGKLNRVENKIVFYQNSLTKPYLSEEKKKEYFAKTFIKQKLPSFDHVYEIGFIEDSLKSKIVQIEVYPSPQAKLTNQKNSNLIFKKTIQKIIFEGQNSTKPYKIESYKIRTNRATWDLILKKLKSICNEKEIQLRRLTFSEQDDKQFERVKNSLKKTSK